MINVLHVVPALDGGGIERLLYNYYINMDREKVHFDFVIHSKENGIIGEEFLKLNSRIFYATPKRENFLRYIRDLSRSILSNKYDVIHVHQNYVSWIPLVIARLLGCKIRIAHSHNYVPQEKLHIRVSHWFQRNLILHSSSHLFACGNKAAIWLYGNKLVSRNKVTILNNAIDLDQFNFNESLRNSIRERYGIENKLCIGHVGRFSNQKNHNFLIDIFSKIHDKNDKTVLMLIGTGELLEQIRTKVRDLGLENAVLFLGVRNDVNELYNAMDIFALPSHHEGLPVVLIEVQSAGLSSVVSDTVDKGSDITDTIDFVSLDESDEYWAGLILRKVKKSDRYDNYNKIVNHGYSIKNEAYKLETFYTQFEGVRK